MLPAYKSFFQVNSPHTHGKQRCPPIRRRKQYKCSVHWSWQTNLELHMWTPEIYQSVDLPITIVRLVKVRKIRSILDQDVDQNQKDERLQPYLHFDFEVDARVRELGHWVNFFKRASKPPDIRVKGDSGTPLPSDRTAFCVICQPDRIVWPKRETLNLQKAAEACVKQVRMFSQIYLSKEPKH